MFSLICGLERPRICRNTPVSWSPGSAQPHFVVGLNIYAALSPLVHVIVAEASSSNLQLVCCAKVQQSTTTPGRGTTALTNSIGIPPYLYVHIVSHCPSGILRFQAVKFLEKRQWGMPDKWYSPQPVVKVLATGLKP